MLLLEEAEGWYTEKLCTIFATSMFSYFNETTNKKQTNMNDVVASWELRKEESKVVLLKQTNNG